MLLLHLTETENTCSTELSTYFLMFMEPRNRFQGMKSASLRSLAGRCENPIPTRCLAPKDCLKIPAQVLLGTEKQLETSQVVVRAARHLCKKIPSNAFNDSLTSEN